jgi:hypothetical protein
MASEADPSQSHLLEISDYVHVLPGRLRVRVAEVRRSPDMARRVRQALVALDGVLHVDANPTTGNVLVLFDPERLSWPRIGHELYAIGCLQNRPVAQPSTSVSDARQASEHIGSAMLHSMIEVALTRLLWLH